MRRWIRALFLGFIALLLVLLLLLVLFLNPLLKGVARRQIARETGMASEIGRLDLHWQARTLEVKEFKLFNPPADGGALFLDVPALRLELDDIPQRDGPRRFRRIDLHLASLNLVAGTNGQLNMGKLPLSRWLNDAGSSRPHGPTFGGIDELNLTLDRITFTDLQRPQNNQTYELGLSRETFTNLQTSGDVTNWVESLAFWLWFREMVSNPSQSKQRALLGLLDRVQGK